jgi:capsular exopolysaccharide synthesis family protein
MAQYDLNLRDYWRILRKRKWIVGLITLAFAAMAFAFAEVQQPDPVYHATAVVKYERTTTLVGLLVETISISSGDSITTQAAVVRSFPVLERAAKALKIIPADLDSERIKATPRYIQALSDLRARVTATPEENTTLINITVPSSDPIEAARTANAVAQAYQEENTLLRNHQIREARRFIEEQLAEVGGRLRQAEDGIRSLKERQRFVSLADATTASMTRLANLEGEQDKLRRMQQETASQLQALEDPDAVAGTVTPRIFTDASDPTIGKLNSTLLDLSVERENLLLTLTPRHPQVVDLTARVSSVRESLVRELRLKQRSLQERLAALHHQVQQVRQEQQVLPEVSRRFAEFQREIAVNENLLASLRTKLQEVQIKEKEQVAEVALVRPAIEPARPVNPPQTTGKTIVGLLIGLTVGLVLAFVLESMDTSIGTIQDVESYLEVPVLGLVPNIDPTRDPFLAPPDDEEEGSPLTKMRPFLVCLLHPRSTVAEAYRSLRTNVEFLALEKKVKVICLTSASLMEGKTTTAINLALTIAQMGKKTLLVESDLRKPFLHHAFGIPRDPGLTEVIVGNKDWHECVRTVTDLMLGPLGVERLMSAPNIDKLHLLTSGTPPPNPTEFLNSQRMTDLLTAFRQDYDFVIFDCPPILPVTDAAILAAKTDGVLIVYRVGKIARSALKRSKVLLENVRGKVLGMVLTGLKAEISPDYEELQYYRYAYGHEPERQVPSANRKTASRSFADRLSGLFSKAGTGKKAALLLPFGLALTGFWYAAGAPRVPARGPEVAVAHVRPASVRPVPDRLLYVEPRAESEVRGPRSEVGQDRGEGQRRQGAEATQTEQRPGEHQAEAPGREGERATTPADGNAPSRASSPHPATRCMKGNGCPGIPNSEAPSAMSHEAQRHTATLFGIRVAAYQDLDRAQEHVRMLQAQGVHVAMASVSIPGREGTFHRIVVGNFTTEAAARKALRAQQGKGELPAGAEVVPLASLALSAQADAK